MCRITGCNKPSKVRDLCPPHYQQALRNGMLEQVAAPKRQNGRPKGRKDTAPRLRLRRTYAEPMDAAIHAAGVNVQAGRYILQNARLSTRAQADSLGLSEGTVYLYRHLLIRAKLLDRRGRWDGEVRQ